MVYFVLAIPPTRIPEKYKRYEKSPILPAVASELETTVYHDNAWHKSWFPSSFPGDRREVLALTETMDQMLQVSNIITLDVDFSFQEIGVSVDEDSVANTTTSFSVSQIEQEQEIYDIILHEIVRQLYVECVDRAVLLERVSKRYTNLFYRVPELLSQMQHEIDGLFEANKSLRMLGERIQKEKSSAETQLNEEMLRLASLEEENDLLGRQLEESQLHSKGYVIMLI
jgi:hypothetical protein